MVADAIGMGDRYSVYADRPVAGISVSLRDIGRGCLVRRREVLGQIREVSACSE